MAKKQGKWIIERDELTGDTIEYWESEEEPTLSIEEKCIEPPISLDHDEEVMRTINHFYKGRSDTEMAKKQRTMKYMIPCKQQKINAFMYSLSLSEKETFLRFERELKQKDKGYSDEYIKEKCIARMKKYRKYQNQVRETDGYSATIRRKVINDLLKQYSKP